MIVGIPRSLFYYYYGEKWILFFKCLNIKYIVSPLTNKEIIDLGVKYSNDEMCLSLKNYIGHVAYLKDKCDIVLVPRIDDYGLDNQTCTNFLACYDIINNLFDIKLLNYNISLDLGETERDGFISMGTKLGKSKYECFRAYETICKIYSGLERERKIHNSELLKSNFKVLVIGHPYNVEDNYIGKQLMNIIKNNGVTIIKGYQFDKKLCREKSKDYSNDLYWIFSKELIGSLSLCDVDGVIFFSTFPCGLDSLVNELVMRKISIPYLNIIVDDLNSLSGYETRIESFVDLIKERKKSNA